MADPIKEQEEITVMEAQDGSATVDLPENLLDLAGSGHDDDQDDRQDDDSGSDTEVSGQSGDDDELRAARRNRRKAKKDLIRKTNQEKDVRLQQLQRENEEFRRRLGQLERNTKAEHVVKIDKGIEDAQVRLEYAKMKLAEATQNQDGQAMVEAQTLWQTANDEVRQLQAWRQHADAELNRPQQQQKAIDPDIQRHAANWMRRNPWYNPAATDPDSRIAKKVDELLATQGWNPSDPDYWDELDSRLQRELPHRYNESTDDETRGVKRPRNVVTSSGREASAAYGGVNRNQFVLSPERVKAMKEVGAWDNPERKARMIKQFIAYDRANGNRN